jgi:secreted trypsin-like serine protease
VKKLSGLLAAVFAALAVTAIAPAQTGNYTIDGNTHPNVGALLRERQDGTHSLTILCSGTLIAPRVFLTAGHCADYLLTHNQPTAYVTFKTDYGTDATRGYQITSTSPPSYVYHGTVVQNPDWHAPSQNDTAAIYLDAPVPGIAPAHVAPLGLLDDLKKSRAIYDTPFTNVGYGTSEQVVVPTVGPTFPFDGIRKWTVSGFFALDPEYVHFDQNQTLGYSGTGYGDSGGPTFVDTATGPVIVSVVSTGDVPCYATSVNERTDTTNAQNFINSVLARPQT